MKILFVIPPFYDPNECRLLDRSHRSTQHIFTIPYGVLSIAAYVREKCAGVCVRVLDLGLQLSKREQVGDIQAEFEGMLKDVLIDFEPDIIGVTALFNSCFNYLGLIAGPVKKVAPSSLLIIGGGVATNLYKEILEEFPLYDAVCVGEGELPMVGLLNARDRTEYLKSSKAWITEGELNNGKCPSPEYVVDLDEIPFLACDLINMVDYQGRSRDKITEHKGIEMSIHTSRGCPFKCVFCANGKLHGTKVRFMSVDRVISDVSHMVRSHGVRTLLIEDDHFFSDMRRAKKILEDLTEFGLRIEFPNGLAVYGIDEEVGALLKKAGATTISLAVESGSEYVLRKIINKPLKVSMVKPAVDILRKNGICLHAFIVIGLPGELESHRNETMQLINDVGFDWVHFFLAIPIAGSRLFDICKKKGYLINHDFSHFVINKCNIRTEDIDPVYMEERAYQMNLEANFVNNYNVRANKHDRAIQYFKNVANRYPDHAFAHFYLAVALLAEGANLMAASYHACEYERVLRESSLWKGYADKYGLPSEVPNPRLH